MINTLENARVGDVLMVSNNNGTKWTVTVARMTPTTLIDDKGGKWTRDGFRRPRETGWTRCHAEICTPELATKLAAAQRRDKDMIVVHNLTWDTVKKWSDDDVADVAAAVRRAQAKVKP